MTKLFKFLFVSLFFVGLISCSQSMNETEVNGVATKGAVNSATVEIYAVDSNGDRGELLATTTTSADGSYSVLVDYTGAIEVVISGGSYVDEATGTTVTLGTGDEMASLVANVSVDNQITVSPLTTIAAEYAASNASQGLETAISNANAKVANAFGIADVDISSVNPADLTSSLGVNIGQNAKDYGAILAGISQIAVDNGLSASDVLDLVDEMAQDFSDGQFDGTNSAGVALQFSVSVTPDQAMSGLDTAISNFLSGSQNNSGITVGDFSIGDTSGYY